METNNRDILIKLHMEMEQGIHPKDLFHAFDILEAALYESDRKEVEAFCSRFDVPRLLRRAALEGLREYRHKRVILKAVRPGSIELFAVVAGVSYFVMKGTIGEAVKNGFRSSDFHDEMADFFRSVFDEKRVMLVDSLRRLYKRSSVKTSVRREDVSANTNPCIIVDIHGKPIQKEDRPGSISQELEKGGRRR